MAGRVAAVSRTLQWAGVVNVRDLGGVPLEGGGETAYGALVRADNIRRMSDEGWRSLADHGVTRIVDLRWPEELEADPPRDVDIDVVHVSLLGTLDPDHDDGLDDFAAAGDAAGYFGRMYEEILDEHRPEFGAALGAIADAPSGATLFHCYVGKDRTGLVAALLLRLAGASIDAIAEDYALSGPNLATDMEWVESAPDEHERRRRALQLQSPADAIVRAVQLLERDHGGVEAYVRAAGLDDGQIGRLRQRLTG
jgi:protein-tyrosine phosphatase